MGKNLIPKQILIGNQINRRTSNEEIKLIIEESFLSIETYYNNSIRKQLSRQKELDTEISFEDGCNDNQFDIDERFTAVMSLIIHDRLFVINIGSHRCILCKRNDNQEISITQLSEDHDLSNHTELKRWQNSNVDIHHLKNDKVMQNRINTRCIGDYRMKEMYSGINCFKKVEVPPILSYPYTSDHILLDKSDVLLILLSHGAYKVLCESCNPKNVNRDIVQMIFHEMQCCNDLDSAVKAVVLKLLKLRDKSTTDIKKLNISLIVRSLEKLYNSDMISISEKPLINGDNSNYSKPISIDTTLSCPKNDSDSDEESDNNMDFNDTPLPANQNNVHKKEIDAYVDFSDYDESLMSLSNDEKRDFEQTMSIKCMMRTISEEPSLISPSIPS